MLLSPAHRKVFEGVASRHEMYALFNRHSQAPFDDDRMNGTRYVGEWFEISEADHDHMFEILPPLFYRGDMFAMREFLAASVTSVFFALTIDDRWRWFHGYCDLGDRQSPDRMRAEVLARESRPVRAMNRQEKLDHIWSATGADFRAYADARFPADLRNRQIVLVYPATQGKIWKLLDDLTDEEIAAKLPVQFRLLPETIAA
ncbi:DUF1419 domain-containing protein [Rhizobium anhuiense]|uniref:DUF1419 domain-containing protein n=1 Tax=Rhizobium anhuiense TaxID=1184720 RepID=UPI001441176F|nr:DUF1419 domain-containing protein [Rhizobium anhuiense]NKM57778.1 DUF1419 domain-containing protein [Rhizobium anhuiense]